MRPRPYGRGIDLPYDYWLRTVHCFNEATTVRSWNSSLRKGEDSQGQASMRPRPDGRGIHSRNPIMLMDLPASMRPRPYGRGIAPFYSILFSRTCTPACERLTILPPKLNSNRSSTILTSAILRLYVPASD